ncbi:galactose mutarotase [Sporosarcina sp. ACRSM]|uniref:aldose epimerase family protein n=1 Tax=Sporosarcina sp. ACRSM TaxID=2918216 RepID=UPI001EF65E66|nr:galactose mutarotase [Sporosarcina sp. ACRSM]
MEVKKKLFGMIDKQPVFLYTVKNQRGFELSCLDYGGIITEIRTPDREGKIENVVLGFDTLGEYHNNPHYIGAVVGRFAGRIKNGVVYLDRNDYRITTNENNHHLHGGYKGFSQVLWDSTVIEKENEISIIFSYVSPDGEEGYPGNLEIKMTYTITVDNELIISYWGTSDKKTILNPTNHTYFNLSGDLKRSILDHELKISSRQFIELNEELLPTGKVLAVEQTVFDFQKGRAVRDGVKSTHPQTVLATNGYDHPFLLNENQHQEIVLKDHKSGRKLVVETTEPAVIVYTGNKLEGDYTIRGKKAQNHLGLCLETQAPPDSIKHPQFHSSILDVGEVYESMTKYTFLTI